MFTTIAFKMCSRWQTYIANIFATYICFGNIGHEIGDSCGVIIIIIIIYLYSRFDI